MPGVLTCLIFLAVLPQAPGVRRSPSASPTRSGFMLHHCGQKVTQCRRQPQLIPRQSKSLDNWPAKGHKARKDPALTFPRNAAWADPYTSTREIGVPNSLLTVRGETVNRLAFTTNPQLARKAERIGSVATGTAQLLAMRAARRSADRGVDDFRMPGALKENAGVGPRPEARARVVAQGRAFDRQRARVVVTDEEDGAAALAGMIVADNCALDLE